LVLGVAYKPDVGDTRESPALSILAGLDEAGAEVAFHDPLVEEVQLGSRSLKRTELTAAVLGEADIVVAVTDHSVYHWPSIADRSRVVLDTRNALKDHKRSNVVRL
jgi:UDP-N-acetyl-D-glucosamine dehydrogenase